MADDLGLTQEQAEEVIRAMNDLKIQAMMFDMDIDIETWTLLPKETFRHPVWIQRWREKEDNSDLDVNFDIGDWDER